MRPSELWRRLDRLGYLTGAQKAQALAISRPHVGRMLSGVRRIPPRVVRTLELVERAHPVVLSAPMRRLLARARACGDVVPRPTRRPAPRGYSWDEVWGAMHAMGVIDFPDGRPRITRRGWTALYPAGGA